MVGFYWFSVDSFSPTTHGDPTNAGHTDPSTCESCGQVSVSYKYAAEQVGVPGIAEKRIVLHRNPDIGGPSGGVLTIPLRWFNAQARIACHLVARALAAPLDDTSLATLAAYTWNTMPPLGPVIATTVRLFQRIPQSLTPFGTPDFAYAIPLGGLRDVVLCLEATEAFDSQHQFSSDATIYTGDGTIVYA